MPTDRWIDKEIVVHTYGRILFSLKSERNPETCDNVDQLGRQYAKWNKPQKDIVWDPSYVESKKAELRETE